MNIMLSFCLYNVNLYKPTDFKVFYIILMRSLLWKLKMKTEKNQNITITPELISEQHTVATQNVGGSEQLLEIIEEMNEKEAQTPCIDIEAPFLTDEELTQILHVLNEVNPNLLIPDDVLPQNNNNVSPVENEADHKSNPKKRRLPDKITSRQHVEKDDLKQILLDRLPLSLLAKTKDGDICSANIDTSLIRRLKAVFPQWEEIGIERIRKKSGRKYYYVQIKYSVYQNWLENADHQHASAKKVKRDDITDSPINPLETELNDFSSDLAQAFPSPEFNSISASPSDMPCSDEPSFPQFFPKSMRMALQYIEFPPPYIGGNPSSLFGQGYTKQTLEPGGKTLSDEELSLLSPAAAKTHGF